MYCQCASIDCQKKYDWIVRYWARVVLSKWSKRYSLKDISDTVVSYVGRQRLYYSGHIEGFGQSAGNGKSKEWPMIQKITHRQLSGVNVDEYSCGVKHCMLLDKRANVLIAIGDNSLVIPNSNSTGNVDTNDNDNDNNNDNDNDICKIITHFHNIARIQCGINHNLLLTRNNELYGFGSNAYHEIS
ncbi:hypothetical protein RFI_26553 [Reticulomyxa filosa]|uniref:Uncharacterized protein n=1 Tax=Reticulomyxa filosa TaxID=46433 RepID=X6MAB6_RETFI|nr:hypothetical protein RFI_26553 [Reticulomyxa filosa]|eukprot:ETO10824.1 hypothetical protein RFI_26553 [Reticulomyxa filosa]